MRVRRLQVGAGGRQSHSRQAGSGSPINPHIELRDETIVRPMRVREVKDAVERARLWTLAVAAYPPYADYETRTERQIPVFVAEP
jgi:hypothetical protein